MNENPRFRISSSSRWAEFEPNTTRLFGLVDLNATGLTSGWAPPEESHTWSDGHQSVFECRSKGLEQGCVIEFGGTPFFCQGVNHQDVTLYVNGFRLDGWRLSESKDYLLRARVEPEQLFKRGDHWTMKCVWLFPNAVRPVDKGLSADYRELAFSFASFTVLEG